MNSNDNQIQLQENIATLSETRIISKDFKLDMLLYINELKETLGKKNKRIISMIDISLWAANRYYDCLYVVPKCDSPFKKFFDQELIKRLAAESEFDKYEAIIEGVQKNLKDLKKTQFYRSIKQLDAAYEIKCRIAIIYQAIYERLINTLRNESNIDEIARNIDIIMMQSLDTQCRIESVNYSKLEKCLRQLIHEYLIKADLDIYKKANISANNYFKRYCLSMNLIKNDVFTDHEETSYLAKKVDTSSKILKLQLLRYSLKDKY